MMFFVPTAGTIGIGISIFSYAGTVRLGIYSDTAVMEKPQEIIDGFIEEFNHLSNGSEPPHHSAPRADKAPQSSFDSFTSTYGDQYNSNYLQGISSSPSYTTSSYSIPYTYTATTTAVPAAAAGRAVRGCQEEETPAPGRHALALCAQ